MDFRILGPLKVARDREPVALGDFAFEPFAQAEIVRLEELRLVALDQRIEQELAADREAALGAELEGLIAKQPLRERFLALLFPNRIAARTATLGALNAWLDEADRLAKTR